MSLGDSTALILEALDEAKKQGLEPTSWEIPRSVGYNEDGSMVHHIMGLPVLVRLDLADDEAVLKTRPVVGGQS